MRRIRITLTYDGTDHHGWQIQPREAQRRESHPELPTIQGALGGIMFGRGVSKP